MKKLLLFTVIVLSINFVKAQSFNPFKVDLAVGAAIPQGSGAKGGVLFSLEPKYAVMSRLSVGLRLEAAIMARGYVASDGSYASADVSASASYLLTGDYYYTNRIFRPFTGIGIGSYSFANASFNSQTVAGSSGAKFGTMVRSGFELGHFRLAFEYNIVGKNTQSVDDGSGGKTTITSKNNYMGFKMGFFFGGGRRKEQSGTIHM